MSSFRKRKFQEPIDGTRTSPHTGQVIASTGNSSLDILLGGGLPIGSVCLLEEHEDVLYSKVLCKYFLAEGVVSCQSIFLASLDDKPMKMLRKLPKPLRNVLKGVTENNMDDDIDEPPANIDAAAAAAAANADANAVAMTLAAADGVAADADVDNNNKNSLRIAWRYNDLPIINAEPPNAKIGHYFNLVEKMHPLLLSCAEKWIWNDLIADEDDVSDEDEGGRGRRGGSSEPECEANDDDNDANGGGGGEREGNVDKGVNINADHDNVVVGRDGDDDNDDEDDDDNNDDDDDDGNKVGGHQQQQQQQPTKAAILVGHDNDDDNDDDDDEHLDNEAVMDEDNNDNDSDMDISLIHDDDVTTAVETDLEAGDMSQTEDDQCTKTLPQEPDIAPSPTAEMLRLFHNPRYARLWAQLSAVLRRSKFQHSVSHHEKKICRVCITSLASPLWYDDGYEHDLLCFLTLLRALVHNCLCVCLVSMPMHLVAKYDESLVAKVRNLVDYAIELKPFDMLDDKNIAEFRRYNGILRLHKMAAVNTLRAFTPDTKDFAFKLRRKDFIIEKLHLGPDESLESHDADNEKQSHHHTTSTGHGCVATFSSNEKKHTVALLDF